MSSAGGLIPDGYRLCCLALPRADIISVPRAVDVTLLLPSRRSWYETVTVRRMRKVREGKKIPLLRGHHLLPTTAAYPRPPAYTLKTP